MQAVGFCKGQPCLLVARFLYRHAHCSQVRASLLYRNVSSDLQMAKLKAQSPHGFLHVSSQLKANTVHNDGGTKAVKVKFVLQKRCEFGQQFSVTGDGTPLGAWNPEAAITMQWSEGHIWTAELDLSVGACVEFKVILMAEQEVLEWQPGPNRKLELSVAPSSLVVSVAWSDKEDSLKIEAHDVVEKSQFLRPQDGEEMASIGSLSDLAEEIEAGTIEVVDGIEEQMIKEGSTGNTNREMIEDYAKDFPDEQQTEANDIAAGDQGAIDTIVYTIADLKSEEVLLPFAIPESWCSEEYNERSELSSTRDSIEPSLASPEDIGKGEMMSSTLSNTSNDKEEENEENLVLFNCPDGANSEGMERPMILTTELESSKPTTTTKKDEQLGVLYVPVDVNFSQRKQEGLLSDTELMEVNGKNGLVQNGPNEVSAGDSLETISATLSDNEDHNDKEDGVTNGPSLTIAKVPEDEIPSTAADSCEDAEAKRSVTERQGRKGWSKLWGAFVRGRNT